MDRVRFTPDHALGAAPSGSPPAGPAPNKVERGLDAICWIFALLAVVLTLHGRGWTRNWVLLATFLPLLRFWISGPFRARIVAFAKQRLSEISAFRRGAGGVPVKAAAMLVVLPCLLLFLCTDRSPGGGDTAPVMPTAARFVTHGDYRLDEFVARRSSIFADPNRPWPYYLASTPSGVYSNYPAGMTTYAIPIAAAATLCGADWFHLRTPGRIEKLTAALLAAEIVGICFLIVIQVVSIEAAFWIAAMLALGSSIASTVSGDLSQQGGVVHCMAILLLAESRRLGHTWVTLLAQGCAAGVMLTCRVSGAIFLALFGLWVLVRSPIRAIALAAIAALVYLPWGIFYYRVYGSILGPSAGQLDGASWSSPLANLAGVVLSPGRGLLVYHPWAILALAAIPLGIQAARRRSSLPGTPSGGEFEAPPADSLMVSNQAALVAENAANRGRACVFMPAMPIGFVLVCLVYGAAQLGLASSWRMWWGGHSWGPRLVTELVPLLALLAAIPTQAMLRRRHGRACLAALLLVSMLMHFPVLFGKGLNWNARPIDVDAHPERLWSWSDPPFLRWQAR